MATDNLKHSIKNSGQTAADGDIVTIWKSPALYLMAPSPTPTAFRLAAIPHDWHTAMRYESSRSFKVNYFYGI